MYEYIVYYKYVVSKCYYLYPFYIELLIIFEYFYQYKVFYEINRITNHMKLKRLFIKKNFECNFLKFLLFAFSKHTLMTTTLIIIIIILNLYCI